MLENEKLLINITIFGFFIVVCLMTGIIRYETKRQFFKDMLIAIVMGSSCYLALNYWINDSRTRVGISGLVILCSRPLYDWINNFIKDWLTKLIMKIKRKQIEENEEIETK